MDSNYATEYRNLYENHWWWRARESAICREIERLWPDSSCLDILDIGCGDGLFFDRLEQYGHVEGVEVDPLTVSPEGPWRDRIHIGPFDNSFQPKKQYDLILMLDVLEHLDEAADSLRYAASLLTEKGTLLITVPAFRSLWTLHDDLNQHVTRFTKNSFTSLACEAGMHIDQMRYLFHWTYPAKLAIRLKEMLFPCKPSPPQLPPLWMNSLLTGLTRAELALVSRLPVPFGSSLLAVGGKADLGATG